MFPRQLRLRVLEKLAQSIQTATPPSTPDTAPPIKPGLPPPVNFVASDVWGWLNKAYNSYTVTTINQLISTLNTALHYSSDGYFDFQKLRNSNFQIDSSAAKSVDTKNLLNLSTLIFKTLLNSGNVPPQPTTGDQVARWVKMISESQALLNLSQLDPAGPIAQKIPGVFKDNVLNLLRTLQMYNPLNSKPQ